MNREMINMNPYKKKYNSHQKNMKKNNIMDNNMMVIGGIDNINAQEINNENHWLQYSLQRPITDNMNINYFNNNNYINNNYNNIHYTKKNNINIHDNNSNDININNYNSNNFYNYNSNNISNSDNINISNSNNINISNSNNIHNNTNFNFGKNGMYREDSNDNHTNTENQAPVGLLPRGEKYMQFKVDDYNIRNIKFSASSGFKAMISINKNRPLKDLFKEYAKRVLFPEFHLGKEIIFLFNGLEIDVNNEENKIKSFFPKDLITITVVDQSEIIGGNNLNKEEKFFK